MFQPYELFIGLRYTRAKRRNNFISFISLISMLGIAVGVTALITVLSVMNGFELELRSRILSMASHASVVSPSGIAEWEEISSLAKNNPDITGAAPFVKGETMLAHGDRVSGAVLQGILPDREPEVSDVGDHMKTGSLSDLKAGKFGIILGQELAWSLGLGMGDKVTVVSPQGSVTPAGTLPRLKRFTVIGIFEVGMYEYDRSLALVHLQDAAKLFQMDNRVSGVRLKLIDMFDAKRVAVELARNMPFEYRISDWTQQHANFFRAVRTEKTVMFVILALIVAVAAFNIVSTLVMVVTDKRADIAILRTLGTTPASVMGIFIVQGTIIGLFGTLLGIIGGILLALNVETIVPAIERLFQVQFLSPDVYYISDLPSELKWPDVWRIGGLAFVLSLLATIYPAWRASRTDPAEALRYE